MSRGGFDGFGAGVDREDIAGLGPFSDGDGEATDIAADVEDATIVRNEVGDATSVFALIEIEAGLLTIHEIDMPSEPIIEDGNFAFGGGAMKDPLAGFESFGFGGFVVDFEDDSARAVGFGEVVDKGLAEGGDGRGGLLDDEVTGVAIDDEATELIGFAEGESLGVGWLGEGELSAPADGAFETLYEEGCVERLGLILPFVDADADAGVWVVDAATDPFAVGAFEVDYGLRRELGVGFEGTGEDPGVVGLNRAGGLFANAKDGDCGSRIGHRSGRL